MKESYDLLPCKTCGAKKEYGYRKGAYCGECVAKNRKSKRIYDKKSPHGSGRKLTCSTCGILKEPGRENESRCIKCKSEEAKVRYIQKCMDPNFAPNGWIGKTNCPNCGKVKETRAQKRCISCKEKINAIKYFARHSVKNAMRRGEMIKMPCEVCKTTEDIQAHHDDYTKPLIVRWLCRKHHSEYHKNKQLPSKE